MKASGYVDIKVGDWANQNRQVEYVRPLPPNPLGKKTAHAIELQQCTTASKYILLLLFFVPYYVWLKCAPRLDFPPWSMWRRLRLKCPMELPFRLICDTFSFTSPLPLCAFVSPFKLFSPNQLSWKVFFLHIFGLSRERYQLTFLFRSDHQVDNSRRQRGTVLLSPRHWPHLTHSIHHTYTHL